LKAKIINNNLTNQNKIFRYISYWKNWAIAASIFLAIFAGIWWQQELNSQKNEVYSVSKSKSQKQLDEIINSSSTDLPITLPDGSKAILKPNSYLSYNVSFNGALREIYLAGEAFFIVKKNPKKPFVVYANGLVTKVLGTSFSIKAFEADKEVTVDVKTGKVSVYAQNTSKNQDPETKGIVLVPNQKVVFDKSDEHLTRSLIEKPVILLSSQEVAKFLFKNASIENIFNALEKAYGVKIVFDKDVMINCRVTTSLTNENLFEKLDIICAAIEASYKIVDAQVIIVSNGCD
jgi:transmembrane sensor